MKSFINYLLKQSVLLNLLFFICVAAGVFAFMELPVERYPDVNMGKVLINTVYPGASPEDVEALVTRKIEDALQDLENVDFISSASYRARSSVMVKFIDDSDYDKLFDELRLKVLGIMQELPAEIEPPTFIDISVNLWLPAVKVNLIGKRSNRSLTMIAEEMKVPLNEIPGVDEVNLEGDYTREFHIDLDPQKLDQFGVTFDQVARALQRANITVPAGDFKAEAGEFNLVVNERFQDRNDVAQTVIRRDADGSFLTVADVMNRARMAHRDPFTITSVNAQNSVSLSIIKSEHGNILDIVPQVKKVVSQFQPVLEQENVQAVFTQDQRVYINDALSILGRNLLVGIALVAVIISFFMGVRNAMLAMVGIPFSFMVTMIFMWISGNSLNEITLFSFVLVSGIVVDDAIVVVENIYRHFQEGESLSQALVNGTSEVGFPVIAATSTTVAAFLPMLIMTGSTGEFFAQIPIAISAAIAASLFECLIILPLHFQDWPGIKKAEQNVRIKYTAAEERPIMAFIRKITNRIVTVTLGHPWISLGTVFSLFIGSMGIFLVSVTGKMPLLNIEFFPADYTYYYVELEGPTGTPLQTTSKKLNTISKILLPGRPGELKSVTATAGYYLTKDYQPIYGTNVGHLLVELPQKKNLDLPNNPNNDPAVHLNYVRDLLRDKLSRDWQLRVRPEESGPPAGKDVNIRVMGSNPEMVSELSRNLMSFLQEKEKIAPHLVNLANNRGIPAKIYKFKVKKKECAEFGLDPNQVASLAGSVLDGRYIGKFRGSDEEVDLKLKIDKSYLQDPEDGLDIPVIQHPSGPLRLKELVEVVSYAEPNKLNRYQNKRSITITADIRPGAPISIPQTINIVQNYYQEIKKDYPGAEISFSGEFESTRESYISLSYAFIIAVLVIYMILAAQFKSYLQPLIIISAVVFSLIGVILGKFVTKNVCLALNMMLGWQISGGIFTITSFIAMVGITGVVVNDSLVLIDFINRGYASGLSRKEAIINGIRIRLRPILLTTLTTSLGLAPMALGIPSYSITWGPMASTFITGLCTATFLTLFIVPIEWNMIMALSQHFKRNRIFGKD